MINPFKRNPSVLAMEGLGNQLFQFAMAHHLATQSGSFAYILTPFTPWRSEDRPFALGSILRNCTHLRLRRDTRFRFLRGFERLNSILVTRIGFSMPFLRLRLSSGDVSMIPKRFFNRLVVTSFYLDFAFSREVMEVVLSELQSDLENFASPRKNQAPYGVIHVRRGDFDSTNFGRLSSAYFKKSLLKMPQVSEVILISDSPDQVGELALELNISKVYGPSQLGSMESLALMSRASFVVGSNSTFSWWGATICCLNGGISILPNRWFRSRELSMTAAPGFDLILIEPIWQD
jgi:hypothetical protein